MEIIVRKEKQMDEKAKKTLRILEEMTRDLPPEERRPLLPKVEVTSRAKMTGTKTAHRVFLPPGGTPSVYHRRRNRPGPMLSRYRSVHGFPSPGAVGGAWNLV